MEKEVILCVDDEKMVLQSIKRELIDTFAHQYLIEVAESGPEGLDLFKELRSNDYEIPVIISDYIMPGMKGDEFLKLIHELAPQAVKIMLTGQAVVEGVANAINEANLFRYLEKPWKKEELKETVCEAFASYHKGQALVMEQRQLLQTQESLQEELRRRNQELELVQEKLTTVWADTPESTATAGGERKGKLTENLAFFQEIPDILEKMKAELDLVVHHGLVKQDEPPREKESNPGGEDSE